MTIQDSGDVAAGVTVVAAGPQGEFSGLSEADGTFLLRGLPLGRYRLWFFSGDARVEVPSVTISLAKTVRVNARVPADTAVEHIVVAERPPEIDQGSSRIGATLDRDFIDNVPLFFQSGDFLDKAPGAYFDRSPRQSFDPVGVSFGGATGPENSYLVDGVNVTGIGLGGFASQLPSPFVDEIEIITGGYGAEYGRSTGGLANIATKSGSNAYRGTVFTQLSPPFANADPARARSLGSVLSGATGKRWETNTGFEVGGPIVKDKLFFWVGYAPTYVSEHTSRHVDRLFDDDHDGVADLAPGGGLLTREVSSQGFSGGVDRHQYAGKLTYKPAANHALSLGMYGTLARNEFLSSPNRDFAAAQVREDTGNMDVSLRWLSSLFNDRWRLEANLGVHRESLRERPLQAHTANLNEVIYLNAPSLADFHMDDEQIQAECAPDAGNGFSPCPLLNYHGGGVGYVQDMTATRVAGQLKSTNTFFLGGRHELKVGVDYELNEFDSVRAATGPGGSRALVYIGDGYNGTLTTFRLQPGQRLHETEDDPGQLLRGPAYADVLDTTTQSQNLALFAQDGYSPLPNLTLHAGVRWEAQYLDNYLGDRAMSINDNIAPRVGAVYDPTNTGRAKLFGHFGRFYQSIPMNLSNRAFGGEGLLFTYFGDPGTCPLDATNWRSGDPNKSWRAGGCDLGRQGFDPSGGDSLSVQKRIKGSLMDEILLGGEYALLSDLVAGVSWTNRRMGRVVENAAGIVANPGDVPGSVVDEAQAQADATAGFADTGTPEQKHAAADAAFLSDALGAVARFPKPRRIYNALTLTLRKRFSQAWMMRGSYTFSRTQGNHSGLYAADTDQLDPNFTTQYDREELLVNREGPLPNDRPHHFRLDGYHQVQLGKGVLTSGLGAVAYSGRPNSVQGNHISIGQGEVFILPRGAMGRTPVVTRFDLHLGYKVLVMKGSSLEVYIDIFNLLNQRTALIEDNEYTLDPVNPIVGGNKDDLRHLKTIFGTPATPNPNFLAARTYQAPVSGRLGLRLSF